MINMDGLSCAYIFSLVISNMEWFIFHLIEYGQWYHDLLVCNFLFVDLVISTILDKKMEVLICHGLQVNALLLMIMHNFIL